MALNHIILGSTTSAQAPLDLYCDTITAKDGFIINGSNILNVNQDEQNLNVGIAAGASVNESAVYDTYVGNYCGYHCTTGSNNAGLGNASLTDITTGNQNTALGAKNCLGLTTGSLNTCVGYLGHQTLTTGSNNICLGASNDVATSSTNNSLCIGNGLTATTNNFTLDSDVISQSPGTYYLNYNPSTQIVSYSGMSASYPRYVAAAGGGAWVYNTPVTVTKGVVQCPQLSAAISAASGTTIDIASSIVTTTSLVRVSILQQNTGNSNSILLVNSVDLSNPNTIRVSVFNPTANATASTVSLLVYFEIIGIISA